MVVDEKVFFCPSFLFSFCVARKNSPPSFLILAVDSLGFDSVSCNYEGDPVLKSGFDLFLHLPPHKKSLKEVKDTLLAL